MPVIRIHSAPLTRAGANTLAAALPPAPGLYVLAARFEDQRTIPLRVGIAAGSGGLRARIVTSSTSHYASACSLADAPLAQAYPNYHAYFGSIRALQAASTFWMVVTTNGEEAPLAADSLKALERALIDDLRPIWETRGYKSQAAFRTAAPDLSALIADWLVAHGELPAWEDRVRDRVTMLSETTAPTLQRVTLELSAEAATLLEAEARDMRSSISEVVEQLIRGQARALGAFGRRGSQVVLTSPAVGAQRRRTVREMGWAAFLARVTSLGLVWDGRPSRATIRDAVSGRAVVVDLNPNTLKGYAFPPPGYTRPAYARRYAANDAINIGELMTEDFDALMAAMGYV